MHYETAGAFLRIASVYPVQNRRFVTRRFAPTRDDL